MENIHIEKLLININVSCKDAGEKILKSSFIGVEKIKDALMVAVRGKGEGGGNIDKLIVNLDVIPLALFESLFTARLAKGFVDVFECENASGCIKLSTDNREMKSGLVADEVNYDENDLYQFALGCLQSHVLQEQLRDTTGKQLQQRLKLLLMFARQHQEVLPEFWYNRVTGNRLSIASTLYLLNKQEGLDWLMSRHSPTVNQVTDWVKAIAQGEIPPEQVALLLSGGQFPGQPPVPSLVVMRWLLPLWRQPAVRQVIHRLKGRQGVHHLDAYLSSSLQCQGNVMQEEKGILYVPKQVALSHNNVLSPSIGIESNAQQDYTTLPIISRHIVPPAKGGIRSPNKPRLSCQRLSNAGLLLLWPLLPQLFSLLGLWDEEQFVSNAARWQAVYALDRLVWGDVLPTESRLTLNQMLCGVSCATSAPPSTPLSLLQVQQVDAWLAAIGQQLASWQKLSLIDIRQLFLQRAGEIGTEGTVPQISVWQEPWDFLLRDWPWPMTLASFPWIEQPLTIVWPLNGFTG